jgi:hypothetical protein
MKSRLKIRINNNAVLVKLRKPKVINNNLILYYLYAESTATRPITDTAQCKYK